MSTIRQNQAPALIDGMTADLGGPRTAALLRRRNAFDFAMVAMAYNFKRSLSLKPAG